MKIFGESGLKGIMKWEQEVACGFSDNGEPIKLFGHSFDASVPWAVAGFYSLLLSFRSSELYWSLSIWFSNALLIYGNVALKLWKRALSR